MADDIKLTEMCLLRFYFVLLFSVFHVVYVYNEFLQLFLQYFYFISISYFSLIFSVICVNHAVLVIDYIALVSLFHFSYGEASWFFGNCII